MRLCDSSIWDKIKNNIDILYNTLNIRPSFFGCKLSIKIIDNNKKIFKKKTIWAEYGGIPTSRNVITDNINCLIDEYIIRNYKYSLQKVVCDKSTKDYKEVIKNEIK